MFFFLNQGSIINMKKYVAYFCGPREHKLERYLHGLNRIKQIAGQRTD